MGKKLYTYGGLTENDLKTRSDCPIQTNITIEVGDIDCTYINVTQVKGVLGSGQTSVSGLCSDVNVNKWSGFSPIEFYNNVGVVASRVKTPYKLGSFAGYNHSAIIPNTSNTQSFTLGSPAANQNLAVGFNVNLGEVNWYGDYLYNYFHLVVDGVIQGSIDLSTYNANSIVNISVDLLAGGQGSTTNFTITGYFGIDATHFNSNLVETDATCEIIIKVAPIFANFLLVDSTSNQVAVADGENVSWANQLDCVLGSPVIASNNLQGTYKCTANSNIGTINVGEHGIYFSTVNCYRIRNSVQSLKYAITTSYRILYNASGTSFNWAIPSELLPQQDGDLFYLEFDNL